MMLTAACLAITFATLGLCCWMAYWVGRTRTLRDSDAYNAGHADGYQAGILHGERVRNELRAERDQRDAALDELGALYDQRLAEGFAPVVRRVVAEVYDHEEAGL